MDFSICDCGDSVTELVILWVVIAIAFGAGVMSVLLFRRFGAFARPLIWMNLVCTGAVLAAAVAVSSFSYASGLLIAFLAGQLAAEPMRRRIV
jgi:hypothetical protein